MRNKLVTAAENVCREKNLFLPRMSKDVDEQLKVAHKVADIVDRLYRKIVWLSRGITWTGRRVHGRMSNCLQKKEAKKKVQEFVHLKYKFDVFTCKVFCMWSK